MFPFVCRRTPVHDEDMPNPMKKDTSEVVMKKLTPLWKSEYHAFLERQAEYKAKKKELEQTDPEGLFAIFIPFILFIARFSGSTFNPSKNQAS